MSTSLAGSDDQVARDRVPEEGRAAGALPEDRDVRLLRRCALRLFDRAERLDLVELLRVRGARVAPAAPRCGTATRSRIRNGRTPPDPGGRIEDRQPRVGIDAAAANARGRRSAPTVTARSVRRPAARRSSPRPPRSPASIPCVLNGLFGISPIAAFVFVQQGRQAGPAYSGTGCQPAPSRRCS